MLLRPMRPFFTQCLKTAVRETRVVTLPQAQNGVPAGAYVFHEFYCDDLTCDCRRVMILVGRSEDEEIREPLATITYGWESPEFYRKWSGEDDPEYHRQLASAMLDPAASQGPFADALCALFIECISQDAILRDRFAHHYRQFRSSIRRRPRRPPGGRRGR